jgi:type II secretory pathway pseudopilin PulG
MNNEKIRRFHGERGASLILAIAFMVVIGGISAAVLATTASGLQDRVALDQARNREYAADGAIETTIAQARTNSGTCPSQPAPTIPLDSFNIHVDCSSAALGVVGSTGTPVSQNNLLFVACSVPSGNVTNCTSSTGANPPIINAQVNFQGTAPAVTTFVQAWSVNG